MNPVVLIVDDSLTVRMDLAHAFEAAGFRPVLSATAAEAREALLHTTADVIVLDVVLPDADGLDLLVELRDDVATAEAVILMLSTEADVKDRIRGMQTGADEYVGKPYDTGYVIAKSRELLRVRTAPGTETTTVLVIDDSATVRRELAGALDAKGYLPITAETGEEGLRLAGDRRPDAVIVDGVLPGIDGPTVIHRLRQDTALRGVPCLLLTAADDRTAELQALDSGADAFVRKGDTTVILAKLAAALRTTDRSVGAADAGSVLGPKKLLVVDDDTAHLETITGSLRGEGYDVIVACSGTEALDLLANQSVDCALLDLRMSDLSGPETCRHIKAAPAMRGVPVIITTDDDDPAAVLDGLTAGADDVIRKSGDFEVLNARIRSHIRRKQFEDQNRRIRDELLSRELAAGQARAAQQFAEARAALTEELERRNEELESFSYSVSHDLRGPLHSLIGFNQLLLDGASADASAAAAGASADSDVLDCARTTLKTAWQMAELIDDLLRLSQVSGGELSRENVDLSAIANATVDELRRRDQVPRTSAVIQDGVTAYADRRLTRILIDNLIGNAWKYTSKKDQPVIEFGQRPSEDGVTYFVRDNGAGFDMADADRLFRPFTRLHSPDQFPGTGIGLATVRRIVDRHGGRIWAEAAIGHGATFYFDLPVDT
jgi:DNA-binding response OmpR family regulator